MARFSGRVRLAAVLAVVVVLAAACGTSGARQESEQGTEPASGSARAAPARSPAPGGEGGVRARPEAIATRLEAPWSLAFLPDGSALVSERDSARILRLRPGRQPEEVARVPGVVPAGEGGLLGIAVAPTYRQDQLVYAYFTAARDNRIVRFRLGGRPEVVLDGIPKAGIHNGGRIAFGPDGMLYAGTGDAAEAGTAQDRSHLGGKILRIRPDGSVPGDNPFPGSPVYSFGHRNVQGLAWDGQRRLWASELGQNTWDEVNLIEPGGNYGWPEVEGRGGGGRFTDPQVVWPTSEASPSGAAFADGSLWVAALRGERLWRVPIDPRGGAGQPESLLQGAYGRLRHVAAAPDGSLWLLTSNRDGRGEPVAEDDRIIRLPQPPAA